MSQGLITRIGQWLDTRWESKATERDLNQLTERVEVLLKMVHGYHADLADIKTRIEKMEVYAGMKRVVDPTKPAVAKSAFAM